MACYQSSLRRAGGQGVVVSIQSLLLKYGEPLQKPVQNYNFCKALCATLQKSEPYHRHFKSLQDTILVIIKTHVTLNLSKSILPTKFH